MKKILFVTQNLARTGSEMVLYYLLKNLDPQKYVIHVLCITRGELYHSLPAHIQKSVTYKFSGKWKDKISRSFLKLIGKDPVEFQFQRIQKIFQADVWYINTIVIPHVFDYAKNLDVKLVTHFHELLHAFTFVNKNHLQQIIDRSHFCIACSEEVHERIREMGHPQISIQHSFIDPELIVIKPERVDELKRKWGISATDFVWVISGVATYMKGLDYLIPILEFFKDRPVKIIWIGKSLNDGLDFYIKRVANHKYPGKLIFTGPLTEDYYSTMAIGHGLLLLSREESFSLVMVEAAYMGIPLVAFNVGISRNFVQEGMGKVVEGCNWRDITSAMEWLHAQPDQNKLKLREAALEFTVQKQLPSYQNLIDQII
jgi:glycosyltransferase involved in cell wall biosynthesis